MSQAVLQSTWPFPSRYNELQSFAPADRAPYWFGATTSTFHFYKPALVVSSTSGNMVRCHLPLMLLLLAFGIFPPQSSLRLASISLAVDLRFRSAPERAVRARTRLHLGSSRAIDVLAIESASSSPASSPMIVPLITRLRELPQNHSAIGSLRRLPTRAHAADSCDLAASRRPARTAYPGSARVADLPALFHAGSSMGTLLQRFLPVRRRRILSDPAVLHAVSHLAVPRLRGFEQVSV